MSRYRIRPFAVKPKQTEQAIFRRAMAVRCIDKGMTPVRIEHIQHRPLLIGRQQGGIDLHILASKLRQQLVVMLENATLHCTLYLRRQSAFAIKALNTSLSGSCTIDQPIQRVVAVATQ